MCSSLYGRIAGRVPASQAGGDLNDCMDFLSCFVSELYDIPGAAGESAGILVLGWECISLLFTEVP